MAKKSQPKPKPSVRISTLSSGEVTILPGESVEDFEQLNDELNEEFEPETGTEQFLVDLMAHARWKLIRVRRLEAQALANFVDQRGGSDTSIIEALKVPGNIFDKLDRMASAAERACSKAVRELAQLRANARKVEKQNEAKAAADPSPEAELAILQNEPNFDPIIYPPHHEEPGSTPDLLDTDPAPLLDTTEPRQG